MLTQRLSFACSLALAVGTAAAQAIHQVGIGGFATIDAAIAAASPGDVILVASGQHAPFTLEKGLTIRGSLATQIITFGTFQPTVAIPAGQTAHLTDLQFMSLACSGHLTLDRCSLSSGTPRLVITQATVHLQRCTVFGTMTTLVSTPVPVSVQDSEVFASESTFRGIDGFLAGTGAITLANSKLYGSKLTIEAGAGPTSAAALVADAASEVVLGDSTLRAPTGPCPLVASQGRLDRCTLFPTCSPLPILPVLGTSRPIDAYVGQNLVVAFRSAPGDLIFVWAAFELAPQHMPFLQGPALLPLASAFPLTALVADAQGNAGAFWPVPFHPSLQHREVWLQGVQGTSLPLPASVAVGGLLR